MKRSGIPSRSSPSPSTRLGDWFRRAAVAALIPLAASHEILAADGSKTGLVDLGRTDPRWKGFQAPSGFRLEVVTKDQMLESPSAMAFDDSGNAYVAEISPAGRTFDVWDSIPLPDGGKARVRRRRKSSTDLIKRLTDTDRDGHYDASEVVVEGVERPSSLLWIKNALYVTALGRLERWSDADGDGRFETRTILIDGFGAVDARGLSGLSLGADGALYLTTGDNDSHAFTLDGKARVNLERTGGLFRCKLDGSDLHLVASGFRNPRGNVAFDADFQPILIDDDGSDGSKLAGVRLIQPNERGDYGWRVLPGPSETPDLELGAVDGERPGKLAGFARIGQGAPSSTVVYNGTLLPEACRGLVIAADPARRSIRGFKLAQQGSLPSLVGETTLLVADDGFCPEQVVVGADSALYILDRRDPSNPSSGRILRLTGSADSGPTAAAAASPPNNWERIIGLPPDQLFFKILPGADHGAAERALRELVDRGVNSRPTLLAYAANATLPSHVRLLGIQGARQFWSDEVEANMVNLLVDPQPEVRRLAAQVLAQEPKQAIPRLVPILLDRLGDPDGRVIREVALAIGKHGETNPRNPAAVLIRRLYAHPQADAATRDAVLRGVERLGDVGVDEVALAVRTRRGVEREQAIRLYSALRSAHAAEELAGLVKIPDLTGSERSALIRQFADFPAEFHASTTGLVDWVGKHPEVEPVVKLAALDTCRLVGNPASGLILALLDDDDESVRVAATNLAAKTRPPGAMAKLATRLVDDQRSNTERLTVARSLRWGGPSGFAALDAAYLGSENAEFRRASLRSMADADRAKALAALTAALSGPDPITRFEAIAILGETPGGARDVGKAYLDGTLTRSDLPMVLQALRPHEANKEVRPVLLAVTDHAGRGPSALASSAIRLRAVESGNPWAGLEVFFRSSARCASCHQVGGKGGRSGPPLDLDAHGLSAEKLVEAIQQPNREIKPGYEAARLALAHSVAPNPAPLAGVDRSRITPDPTKRPAMPPGLDLELTPQELADLVAFLLDSTAQGAVKQGGVVAVDRWVVAGPFAPGADSSRASLDRVDLNKSLAGQDGRALNWLALSASTTGRIDLGGLLGSRPGRAYAASEVRGNGSQTAWLYASTQGGARVYLNGAKVADLPDRSTTFAPSETSEGPTELTRLTLKPGWNLVMVAFDSPASGEPWATFRVASPKPIEVRAPRNDP